MESEIYAGADFTVLSKLLGHTGQTLMGVRKNYYKLILVKNEPIAMSQDDDNKFELKPVLYLLTPLSSTLGLLEFDQKIGYWCIISENCFEQYTHLKLIKVSPLFAYDTDQIIFNKNTGLAVERLFKIISQEIKLEYNLKYDIIFNCLALIFQEAIKFIPEKRELNGFNAASRIFNGFLELLDNQFSCSNEKSPLKLRKATDFAQYLSIHVNHLNAIIKALTGKSTTELIHERIIFEARKLLGKSAYNVAEIAYRLGFEYPAHFNMFYKKHTGITPLTYRKTCLA